ncbi:MAG: hypothetical protein V3U96_01510 [Paracoccaceae bacterium]
MSKTDKRSATGAIDKSEDGTTRFAIVPADKSGREVAEFNPETPPLIELSDLDSPVPRGRLLFSFVIVVVAPLIAAAWFLTSIASDRFTAEFRVAVRSSEAAVFAGMGELMGLPGASRVSKDSQVLVQFMQSRAIVEELQGKVPVRGLFGKTDIDWLSRIAPEAPIEEFVKYWNKRVETRFEASNSTVVVRVTAFTPQDALTLSELLLVHAESFVNTLSENAREDAVDFARNEVRSAEDRLTNARIALVELQDRENVLDPIKSGESSQALTAGLQEEITRQRAKLATQLTQLSNGAPSVRGTLNVIEGLELELRRIDAAATSQPSDALGDAARKPLSAVIREFQTITGELGYAEGAYASALSSLEAARIDAARKQIYLATVVAPGLPEQRVFPRPASDLTLIASIALAIWIIGLIGLYSIREHR